MNLVNEHEYDSSITPGILGEEREGVRMVEKLITKGPING